MYVVPLEIMQMFTKNLSIDYVLFSKKEYTEEEVSMQNEQNGCPLSVVIQPKYIQSISPPMIPAWLF